VHINDKSISLTPGMEVTAQIRSGRQSVAGYFLDPLVQTAGRVCERVVRQAQAQRDN
jgi:hemolysin D